MIEIKHITNIRASLKTFHILCPSGQAGFGELVPVFGEELKPARQKRFR